VVVVNHHLLLADLALKESGFGELLPGADVVIVDEAHQLPDVAQQFFGVTISTRELELLARDVAVEARLAGVAGPFEEAAWALQKSAAETRIAAQRHGQGRLPWAGVSPAVADSLRGWDERLETLDEALAEVEDANAG